MVDPKDPVPVRIEVPQITHLPTTPCSEPTVLEPYAVDLLPVYGYKQEEFLISGIAVGEEYCTRLLLRAPKDLSKFSGVAVVETAHIWAGTSCWRALSRWIMRNGHAWLEVDSQAPVAKGSVKGSNPSRYSQIHFPSSLLAADFHRTIPFTANPNRQQLEDQYSGFMKQWWDATPQSPEILTAASHALRSGLMGFKATCVVMGGISQTGGVTRRFLTHSSHLRTPNGVEPFDGLIPAASGGAALPDPPRGSKVKVFELLGEAEFQSVRWACGVSGQTRGVSHRRPDSPTFRLYEVAGMGHRESRYFSLDDKKRFGKPMDEQADWSTFPNSFIYAAVFETMLNWILNGTPPPEGRIISTVGNSDEVRRDEHGNAIGGVRSVHMDVPTSQVIAATPLGRPSWYAGSEVPFEAEKLRELYGDVETYRRLAGESILNQIEAGFLLPCDAEVLRRESVERVLF